MVKFVNAFMSNIATNNSVRSELLFWLLITCIYASWLMSMRHGHDEMLVIRLGVFSSLLLLGIQVFRIVRISNMWFSPCLIYLALYYLFQNGILFLSATATEFNTFYIDKFGMYVIDATVFASISNVVAGFSCIAAILIGGHMPHKSKVEMLPELLIRKASMCGFLITGSVAIPLVIMKTGVALGGGYHAVRTYEESIPFFINFVEYLFMPFSILSLLYVSHKRVLLTFTVIWLILTAYCGDRTVGLSGLLIVSFLNFKNQLSRGERKKAFFKFACILGVLMLLVQAISIVRSQGSVSDIRDDGNPILHFFSELGFSTITLFSMMDIVPSCEDFQNGTGYLAALISGFIPANADPTGIIRELVQYRDIQQVWMDTYFTFKFGLGFSLNAEAYINFGWYGFFSLFIVNYVVFHFLNYFSRTNVSKFDTYISLTLLFLWCTLPRRDSYYVWKALMYSVILMRIYLLFFAKFCIFKKKSCV